MSPLHLLFSVSAFNGSVPAVRAAWSSADTICSWLLSIWFWSLALLEICELPNIFGKVVMNLFINHIEIY